LKPEAVEMERGASPHNRRDGADSLEKRGGAAMSMAKVIEWLTDGATVCVVRVRGVKIYQQGFTDTKSGLANLCLVRAYFVEPVEGALWDWMKITKYPSLCVVDESTEHAAVEKGKIYAFDLATLETENGLRVARMRGNVVPLSNPSKDATFFAEGRKRNAHTDENRLVSVYHVSGRSAGKHRLPRANQTQSFFGLTLADIPETLLAHDAPPPV
jgi:hypothetical protein